MKALISDRVTEAQITGYVEKFSQLKQAFRDEVPITRVAEVVIVRVAYVLLQGLLATKPTPASCTIFLHADAEEEGGGDSGRVVANSRVRSRLREDHRLNI